MSKTANQLGRELAGAHAMCAVLAFMDDIDKRVRLWQFYSALVTGEITAASVTDETPQPEPESQPDDV